MAYLKITPGVGSLSGAGRKISVKVHLAGDDLKQAVWARDGHACRYCGFESHKYQEVNYVGGAPLKTDSYATSCIFCYQCFHLDQVERMQSGALI